MEKDKELQGNEIIEQQIEAFLKNRTEEQLSMLLSSIRAQMNAGASFVVAIEAEVGTMNVKEVTLKDGRNVGLVFTNFEEQMKGTKVMSTFMVGIRQLFEATMANNSSDGLLLNAYGKAFVLDRTFIRIILG